MDERGGRRAFELPELQRFVILPAILAMIPGITVSDGAIPDAIPLSTREKELKAELESIVDDGLEKFLKVGSALAELRNKRLYRVEYPTFEAYIQARFGLHRSSVDGVIRSAQTAKVLIDSGIQLPPDTTATSLRAVSALPGNELQVACYQLAQSLSPARAPSEPLVSRLCRIVRNALDGVEEGDDQQGVSGARYRRRSIASPQREVPFVRPLIRLTAWQGFSADIVLSTIHASENAAILYRACSVMVNRCREVQDRLAATYPEVTNAS